MRKILMIDDDVTMAGLLKTLLSQHGFELVNAARPSEAHDFMNDEAVELILLDVMLPEMDGFEVCRSLREAGEGRPIIMLTVKIARYSPGQDAIEFPTSGQKNT